MHNILEIFCMFSYEEVIVFYIHIMYGDGAEWMRQTKIELHHVQNDIKNLIEHFQF